MNTIPELPDELASACEVRFAIPKKLAWCCVPEALLAKHQQWLSQQPRFLCIDTTLHYEQFFADFGPLNLGCTIKYCRMVDKLLSEGLVVHYCSDDPHRRTNAATLCCLFSVLARRTTAHQAYAAFKDLELQPYRDASFGLCSFPLLTLDVLRGAERAVAHAHFRYDDFDVDKYEALSHLENGDANWIVPGRFLAFSGPHAQPRQLAPGKATLSAAEYVPLFQRLGVTCVVRFNSPLYDKRVFTSAGVRHADLQYTDGSNPPPHILQRFLQICEDHHGRGAVAVHCKAGLGRTGTNIAAYMIKHFGYTAHEAIAWLRLCRPGSVIGPQQHYLVDAQARLRHDGNVFRAQVKPHLPHWTDVPKQHSSRDEDALSTSSCKKKKPPPARPPATTLTTTLTTKTPPTTRSVPQKAFPRRRPLVGTSGSSARGGRQSGPPSGGWVVAPSG